MDHLLDAALKASPALKSVCWPAGPRLRLREFRPTDQASLMAMHRDSRLRALLIDDYPLEHAAVARLFLQRMAALYREHEGLGIWHAECRIAAHSDWSFCGWFNLMPMPDTPAEVELGCRLQSSSWGQGLAFEGGEWLLQHAMSTLELPRVWGVCHPSHRSVQHCLLTLGFRSDGIRDYTGQPAAYFVLERDAWLQALSRPRRQRMRDAAMAMRRQGRC